MNYYLLLFSCLQLLATNSFAIDLPGCSQNNNSQQSTVESTPVVSRNQNKAFQNFRMGLDIISSKKKDNHNLNSNAQNSIAHLQDQCQKYINSIEFTLLRRLLTIDQGLIDMNNSAEFIENYLDILKETPWKNAKDNAIKLITEQVKNDNQAKLEPIFENFKSEVRDEIMCTDLQDDSSEFNLHEFMKKKNKEVKDWIVLNEDNPFWHSQENMKLGPKFRLTPNTFSELWLEWVKEYATTEDCDGITLNNTEQWWVVPIDKSPSKNTKNNNYDNTDRQEERLGKQTDNLYDSQNVSLVNREKSILHSTAQNDKTSTEHDKTCDISKISPISTTNPQFSGNGRLLIEDAKLQNTAADTHNKIPGVTDVEKIPFGPDTNNVIQDQDREYANIGMSELHEIIAFHTGEVTYEELNSNFNTKISQSIEYDKSVSDNKEQNVSNWSMSDNHNNELSIQNPAKKFSINNPCMQPIDEHKETSSTSSESNSGTLPILSTERTWISDLYFDKRTVTQRNTNNTTNNGNERSYLEPGYKIVTIDGIYL